VSDRLLLYHYEKHLVPRRMFSRYRVLFSQAEKLGVYLVAQTAPGAYEEYLDWVRRIPLPEQGALGPLWPTLFRVLSSL